MLRRLVIVVVVLALAGAAAFYLLTIPRTLDAVALLNHRPDLAKGAYLFIAGGCASCHAAPDSGDMETSTVLAGGLALASPFGTFYAPNISPDPDHGIGKWSALDFVNAMKFGVAPNGSHLYPAFPYVSYQRMKVEDLIDLKAYIDTLPPVASDAPPNALPFPFSIRRGVGLWKLLYVDGKTLDTGSADALHARGAYLVRGPGHCGECHTPRNLIGGPIAARAYGGAAALDGKGRVPNITSGPGGIDHWSEADIVTALETGFTPDFDSLGGTMADVVRNTSRLTPQDRAAIAAYLKSLPPVASESPSEAESARAARARTQRIDALAKCRESAAEIAPLGASRQTRYSRAP